METTLQPALRVAVAHIVTVSGELDAHTAPLLLSAVRALPAGDRRIDASEVSFAGTAALGALLQLRLECERLGATLAITASPALKRISQLAGMDEALPLA